MTNGVAFCPLFLHNTLMNILQKILKNTMKKGILAEKYASGESTSITYEIAEQLMAAVLYCMHELEESGYNSLILNREMMTVQKAYEIGADFIPK